MSWTVEWRAGAGPHHADTPTLDEAQELMEALALTGYRPVMWDRDVEPYKVLRQGGIPNA